MISPPRFPAIMGISAHHLPDNFCLAHVDGYDYRVEKGMWVRHKYHKEKVLVEVYFDPELQDEVHVYEFVSRLDKPHTYGPSSPKNHHHPKAVVNDVPPPPRKRGRPRTHFKKYARDPTEYNKFVQQVLPLIDASFPVNARMRIAARMWREQRDMKTTS